MTKNNIKSFLALFPDELRKYADIEQTNAGVKVNTKKSLTNYIYGKEWNKIFSQFSKETNYRFSTIFEYLLAEILEVSGNVTMDKNKSVIEKEDIEIGIKNDLELNKMF